MKIFLKEPLSKCPGGFPASKNQLVPMEKSAIGRFSRGSSYTIDHFMNSQSKNNRFVFQTKGVCPPEIHFEVDEGVLRDVRFVGGGCPGNAKLVSRLLTGRPIQEVTGYLNGIDCRNGTSCPDQLALALKAAEQGGISPVESFRLHRETSAPGKIALIGGLDGNGSILEELIPQIRDFHVDAIYCLGNLTGKSPYSKECIQFLRKNEVVAVQGLTDWQYAQGIEKDFPPMAAHERDWLLRLPQVLHFSLGNRNGLAFFGEYIQNLPGFSDYEPFALEMNMVCGLTQYMQDETVFPALEAMIPQFEADIIVFSQPEKWGKWHVAGKDFISLGPAQKDGVLSWGLLEAGPEKTEFSIMTI